MLSFAPSIVNDELLYSYVARWFALSGYKTVERFNEAAFGRQVAHDVLNAHRFTPLHCEQGVVRDEDDVAETMTLLPFARVFIGEAAYERLQHNGDQNRRGVELPLSLSRPPWTLEFLNFCEACALRHQEKVGRGAWLRTHNLPGVTICLVHLARLRKHPIKREQLEIVPIIREVTAMEPPTIDEIRYAKVMKKLLGWRGPVIRLTQWEVALVRPLKDRFGTGRKGKDALCAALGNAYLPEFLSKTGVSLDGLWRTPIDKLFDRHLTEMHPSYVVLTAKLMHPGGIMHFAKRALLS